MAASIELRGEHTGSRILTMEETVYELKKDYSDFKEGELFVLTSAYEIKWPYTGVIVGTEFHLRSLETKAATTALVVSVVMSTHSKANLKK